MVNFNTIKPAITAACKLVNFDTNNISERNQFVLNLKALEEGINKLESSLHVIGFTNGEVDEEGNLIPEVHSKSITNSDLSNISMEYFHKKKEIESLVNDKFNYVEFMIYCTDIEDQEIKKSIEEAIIDQETGKSVPIIENINDEPNDFLTAILANLPVYKVLIVRKFNYKKDKFTYNSIFRSNYAMIDYIDDKFKKNEE